MGSLVGGELVRCEDATKLAAADEFKARVSTYRESGVFGSFGEDEYCTLDAFFCEAADCAFSEAGVLKVGGGFVETAGPFPKNEVKLFCFIESVESLCLGGILCRANGFFGAKLEVGTRLGLFGDARPATPSPCQNHQDIVKAAANVHPF